MNAITSKLKPLGAGFVRCFFGDTAPAAVGWAVFLGLVAGFVTGWNYTFAAVLLTAACFNLPGPLFLLACTFGWALSIPLAGLSYQVGYLVLDILPAGAMIGLLGDGPIAALFGWDRYVLVGGTLLAMAVAVPAARAAAGWRSTLLEADADSTGGAYDESDPALRLGERLAEFGYRVATWLTWTPAMPCPVPVSGNGRIGRRFGVVGCTLATVIAVTLPWAGVWHTARRDLLTRLSVANRAEVSAARIELSPWSGRVTLQDFRAADPVQLDRDWLRAGKVTAELHAGELLRGRLHIEQLTFEDVRTQAARPRLAQPFGALRPSLELPSIQLSRNTAHGARSIELPLDECLAGWTDIAPRLAAFERLVAIVERIGVSERVATTASVEVMQAARSPMGHPRPQVLVEQIQLRELRGELGLGDRALVAVANVSSNPALTGKPATIEIVAPDWALELDAKLNLHKPATEHEITFHAEGLNLVDLLASHPAGRRTNVYRGELSVSGQGTFGVDRLQLETTLEANQLDAQLLDPRDAAHLSPALWNDGLRRMRHLTATVPLVGTWRRPALAFEAAGLAGQFQEQLVTCGAADLAQLVESRLTAQRRTGVAQQVAETKTTPGVKTAGFNSGADRYADRTLPPTGYRHSDTDGGVEQTGYALEASTTTEPAAGEPLERQSSDHPYPTTGVQPGRYDVPTSDSREVAAMAAAMSTEKAASDLPGPIGLELGYDEWDAQSAPAPSATQANWQPPVNVTDRDVVPTAGSSPNPIPYVPPDDDMVWAEDSPRESRGWFDRGPIDSSSKSSADADLFWPPMQPPADEEPKPSLTKRMAAGFRRAFDFSFGSRDDDSELPPGVIVPDRDPFAPSGPYGEEVRNAAPEYTYPAYPAGVIPNSTSQNAASTSPSPYVFPPSGVQPASHTSNQSVGSTTWQPAPPDLAPTSDEKKPWYKRLFR